MSAQPVDQPVVWVSVSAREDAEDWARALRVEAELDAGRLRRVPVDEARRLLGLETCPRVSWSPA